MKRLLRSIVDIDGTLPQLDLRDNLVKLIGSPLEWNRDDDQKVFDFVKVYYGQMHEIPSSATLNDYFEKGNDQEGLERLKDIAAAQPYVKTNFTHLLKGLVDDQTRLKALTLLAETQEIIKKGVTIDGEVRKGTREGLDHVVRMASRLIDDGGNTKTSGFVNDEGKAVVDALDAPPKQGRFTGIQEIDEVLRGLKNGQLHIHAAFTGELKSSFAMTWAYNLVTRYRCNVLYISMEMPYEDMRRMFHVMHTSNAKFANAGLDPLDDTRVVDQLLSPTEKSFLESSASDFETNPTYGKLYVWCPGQDVTIEDIRAKAEQYHQDNELGFLVIDHAVLVEPRKGKRSRGRDYRIELNSVFRDAKQLALNFNHGEGVPVLLLHQLNRKGKEAADLVAGQYTLGALSDANEAERSADVITTTYLNDTHRRNGTTAFCNLKSRYRRFFQMFTAMVDWRTKRISSIEAQTMPNMSVDEV